MRGNQTELVRRTHNHTCVHGQYPKLPLTGARTHARAHAALTDRTEQSRPQLHGAPASVAHSPRRVIAGPQNKSPCLLPRAL